MKRPESSGWTSIYLSGLVIFLLTIWSSSSGKTSYNHNQDHLRPEYEITYLFGGGAGEKKCGCHWDFRYINEDRIYHLNTSEDGVIECGKIDEETANWTLIEVVDKGSTSCAHLRKVDGLVGKLPRTGFGMRKLHCETK